MIEEKPVLQLSGQDGNAFFIIGWASRVAREAGWSQEKIDEFTVEAMSGKEQLWDYDHVLQTCMKYFEVK